MLTPDGHLSPTTREAGIVISVRSGSRSHRLTMVAQTRHAPMSADADEKTDPVFEGFDHEAGHH
jgi:hypothetical protein